MTVRNLNYLCAPRSVALIGAGTRPGSVGATVRKNLLEGGFKGSISLVNPKYTEIEGHRCYASVSDLPEVPDLAVLATPPSTIVGLIEELGAKGTRAAIALAAGLGEQKKAMIAAAQPHCLRILGPNCIGLMSPNIGLNASFAHRAPVAGDLAFVSQSGALVTAVIDWAAGRGIGFSHVVSLGEMADVDLGDMLDFLATDPRTRAILLYIEAVTHAPKFISAARRAARMKPVVVVKTGRHAGGAHAALSHTGALAGSDAAYNAAFRRSGLLRVKTLDELFAAAETLSRVPRLHGERLAILTNGGGAGVLATDEFQDWNGTLASFGVDTIEALDRVLPPTWSHGNPVDIIGDAGTKRYSDALEALLHDHDSDAILILHCPTATVSAIDAGKAVVDTVTANRALVADKPVMTCWLGDGAVQEARSLFEANKIPTFDSTSSAITGLMQLVDHARSQDELMQTPRIAAGDHAYDEKSACREIRRILDSGRTVASALEAKTILAAYGIPTDKAVLVPDPAGVRSVAADILKTNDACVIKIASPDISHKSDAGGVRLNLESATAAEQAAIDMLAKIKAKLPEAHIDGFTVEPMIKRPDAFETIVGMSVDQTFGPMLLFGAGGVAVEVLRDSVLALPPLDMRLARQMIDGTRISRLLKGYRDHPPADMDAISDTLVRISDLIVAHPEIRELDINPLLADKDGVIAIDARMKLADESVSPRLPLAIRPYPAELAREVSIDSIGEVLIRPIRPEDEPAYAKFFSEISEDDVRLRFFTGRRAFPHAFLAALTQIDYAREMAFVAIDEATQELIGGSRLVLEPDLRRGEFGILVRSDLHGRGLGWQLMSALLNYAQHEGVEEITGLVNVSNTHMLDMATDLGFETRTFEGDASVREVVWHPAASAAAPPAIGAVKKQSEKADS
ncbi:bifunctional acetate--CoA ligase family protein/GNAT family N-acetyltransferase [Hyphomicrobium sp.]|jgi:acetyltransferase|uniref:bifunctional acetate--CoA ligase family protein/GNAT family N-acetyltransferase n=1 Tax=Hyphomicrobium sp. TaxID=82 RepID=UPI0035690343